MLGRGGEAVVDLVGRLQAHCLAINDLDGQISTDRTEQARQGATLEALKSLRKHTSDAAAALGMKVDRVQSSR